MGGRQKCVGFLERIDYAMSSSPGGPWTYEGSLMPSGEYDG